MNVAINRKLNLVLTLEDEKDKPRAYVHHTPIDRAVFEAYFMSITRAYAAMAENGGEWMLRMGPRTALLVLKRAAQVDGSWEGADGVENGLVNEIRRLTNVFAPGPNGWEMIPYADAKARGIVSADEVAEVENAITFFTLASSAMRTKEANGFLEAAFGLYGAQVTYSSPMEWINSLATSTQEETTGETVQLSSIPH